MKKKKNKDQELDINNYDDYHLYKYKKINKNNLCKIGIKIFLIIKKKNGDWQSPLFFYFFSF